MSGSDDITQVAREALARCECYNKGGRWPSDNWKFSVYAANTLPQLAQAMLDLSTALEKAPKVPAKAWNPDDMADFIERYEVWWFKARTALEGRKL